jgi:hypothetical protein
MKARPAASKQRRGGNDEHTGGDRDHQRTPENGLLFHRVTPAHGLGHKTGGGRAQEIEGGENEVEQDRRNRQAAQQRRITQPPDHGGIDQPQKRVVRKASVIGTAMANTMRLVTSKARAFRWQDIGFERQI